MELQTRDVFVTMRPELERVARRVEEAAAVEFPVVSSLVLEIVRAGGKRLRPLVLLLAGRAYAPDSDLLITAAAGIELLHTASLVHDDTVDRSSLRRGKPTLNSMLSSGSVILLGDFLFAQSAILAAATQSPRAVSIFASTLADICDGQLREMFDAHQLSQTREEYERRIYGKTASLFAGAAEMGALLSGAPEADIQAMRAYGTDVGLAFQIMDDILDVREGTEHLGKPAGNDLRQGTVTLPTMLYAAALDPGSDPARLIHSVIAGEEDSPAAIEQVVNEIRASDAIAEATAYAVSLTERAKSHARRCPDPETVVLLEEVADLVWNRSA